MRLLHIVSIGQRPNVISRIEELGLVDYLAEEKMKVYEDDDVWENVFAVIREFDLFYRTEPEYSEEDFSAASFFMIFPRTIYGYPENSNRSGYLETTYDGNSRCDLCGVGAVQVNPFKVRAVPSLRKKSIFLLNWVFDEFFLATEKWRSLIARFGLETKTVLKGSEELTNVKQLLVAEQVELEMPANFETETCIRCGASKFVSSCLQRFTPEPKIRTETRSAIFKSVQWFGSGGQAFHLVVITREFYDALNAEGITDIYFFPCGITPITKLTKTHRTPTSKSN